jgi:phenylalanine-4-hydroxylase
MLYARQEKLLAGRACDEFLDGLHRLRLSDGGIPDFRHLNERLSALTGWTVVAVPHLVPDAIFFEHLANRRFPAGRFMRDTDHIEYIQEPDVFHDVFGHVPMLAHAAFADYMQEYGKGGLRALGLGALKLLARLYWYTVEFGLIQTPAGLRIYGSGIVSSAAESVFVLDSPSPNRIAFDLHRVMRTDYRIDDFQESYFVIDSFAALRKETYQDFAPIYHALEGSRTIAPGEICPEDRVLIGGTRARARMKKGAVPGTAPSHKV